MLRVKYAKISVVPSPFIVAVVITVPPTLFLDFEYVYPSKVPTTSAIVTDAPVVPVFVTLFIRA